MPDHVHALIQVGSVDLIAVVRSVKAYISRSLAAAGLPTGFWQPRSNDKGIREHQVLDHWITYILDNPVRAGLVADWADYPWIGGSLLDDTRPNTGP